MAWKTSESFGVTFTRAMNNPSPAKNIVTAPPDAWSEVDVAGHPCEVFEPAQSHPQGFAAIYLHGVHLQRLRDQPEFCELLSRHGLRVACPQTQRSWWTDRICAEFDPQISAERYIVERVLPWMREYWQVAPPKIGLFGTSMGGQGALRFGFKHPGKFPVVVGISPAIDYHLRMREGDETLPLMYRDTEDARQDTATLARASAQLAAQYMVLLRPGGLSLARKRRAAADEALGPGRTARVRSGDQRRRP